MTLKYFQREAYKRTASYTNTCVIAEPIWRGSFQASKLSLIFVGNWRNAVYTQPLLISHNSLFLQPFSLRPLSAEESSWLPGGLLWPAKGNAGTIGWEASSAPKAGFRGYLETRGRIFSFIFAECKNTNSGYFITVACLDSFLGWIVKIPNKQMNKQTHPSSLHKGERNEPVFSYLETLRSVLSTHGWFMGENCSQVADGTVVRFLSHQRWGWDPLSQLMYFGLFALISSTFITNLERRWISLNPP